MRIYWGRSSHVHGLEGKRATKKRTVFVSKKESGQRAQSIRDKPKAMGETWKKKGGKAN